MEIDTLVNEIKNTKEKGVSTYKYNTKYVYSIIDRRLKSRQFIISTRMRTNQIQFGQKDRKILKLDR